MNWWLTIWSHDPNKQTAIDHTTRYTNKKHPTKYNAAKTLLDNDATYVKNYHTDQ